MPSRDVRLEVDPKAAIVPDQYTGTTSVSTGIDLSGAEAALVVITTGAYGGTTPTATFKIQESDVSNSGFTDVADSDLIGVTGNTSGVSVLASTVQKVSYVGSKRYVGVIISAVGGTSPVIRLSATVLREHLRHAGSQPV